MDLESSDDTDSFAQCYEEFEIPSFNEIGNLVPKKKSFAGFYHVWTWRHLGHVTRIICSVAKILHSHDNTRCADY